MKTLISFLQNLQLVKESNPEFGILIIVSSFITICLLCKIITKVVFRKQFSFEKILFSSFAVLAFLIVLSNHLSIPRKTTVALLTPKEYVLKRHLNGYMADLYVSKDKTKQSQKIELITFVSNDGVDDEFLRLEVKKVTYTLANGKNIIRYYAEEIDSREGVNELKFE